MAVVSDHGEAFGEHGYFAHRQGVYGETNRILFMVSAPKTRGRSSEGRNSSQYHGGTSDSGRTRRGQCARWAGRACPWFLSCEREM